MTKRGLYPVRQTSWPPRLADFRHNGLRARLVNERRGYQIILPAGTIGIVRAGSLWDRLDFIAQPCGHCGVQMRCSAAVTAFELIDEEGNLLP